MRIFWLIIICYILVSGCTSAPQSSLMTTEESSLVYICDQPENYGNGVLYFSCTEGHFITGLAQYIGTNNITVTAIAGVPNEYTYNHFKGYIVVVKPNDRMEGSK